MTAPSALERPAPGDDHGPEGLPALLAVVVVALAAGLIGTVVAQFGVKSLYVLGGAIVAAGVLYAIRDLIGPPVHDAVERMSPRRFRPHAERRPPSSVAVTLGVVVSAALAGGFAWLVAQQGLKIILAVLAVFLVAVAVWLLWPLLVMLVSTPSDAPAKPTPDWKLEAQAYEAEHGRRTYPGFVRFVGSTIVVFSAGIISWLAVSQGVKGIAGLVGIIAVVGALLWVKNKSLFFTFVTICSMVAFVHKSFGPQDLTLSGGAVSINITTVDVLILMLYGIWMSEGTFVADVRAASKRRILWLPLVGVLFLLPSLVKAVDPYHSFSELFRMAFMYLLFFYVAVRVRTRAMVWAILAGLAVFASIEFVVVILQWKTGGVLGLSFLGVPTQLTARTTDTSELGRPFGTIIHPVFMGAVMGSLGLLAVALGLTLKRSLLKVTALGMALVCTLPLYLAHTRAALVAFVLVVLIMVGVAIAHRQLEWRSVGRIVVVLLITAAVFWPQLTKVWSENFNTGHFSEEVESRKELNDLAGRMIDDHPVLGVGLNNFELVMGPYEKYGIIFFDNPVHNVYLLYLAETGIVGLTGVILVGVGMYNIALRLSRSHDRLLGGIGLGVSGAMAFLMVEELLGFSLRQDIPLIVYWLLAGLAVACFRMAGFDGSRGLSSRRRLNDLGGGRGSSGSSPNGHGSRPPMGAFAGSGTNGNGNGNGSNGHHGNGHHRAAQRRHEDEIDARMSAAASSLAAALRLERSELPGFDPTGSTGRHDLDGPVESVDLGDLDELARLADLVELADLVALVDHVDRAGTDGRPPVHHSAADLAALLRRSLADRTRAQVRQPEPAQPSPTRPRLAWPRAGVGGTPPPAPSVLRRNRRRWRPALAMAITISVLSFGFVGSGATSSAAVPFQMSQLKIVFSARVKLPAGESQADHPIHSGIFTANGDGSGVTPLLPRTMPGVDDPAYIYNWPQWALGGTKIVFTQRTHPTTDVPLGAWENIFMMDADGTHLVQLTNLNYRAVQPKVSADGRSVLYTAKNPQFPIIATFKLDLETLESTNLSQVTAPRGAVDADPKWTPQGRVVLASSITGETQVNVFDADGRNREALTDDQYFNTDPEISPNDPDTVAYSSYRGDHLILDDPNDPNAPELVREPDDIHYDPFSWEITVRNARTGSETQITRGLPCSDFLHPIDCQPGDGSGWKPVWTPDGKQIGYTGVLDRVTTCICVANADGTGARPVLQSTTLALKWFDWVVPDPARVPRTAVTGNAIGSRKVSSKLLLSSTDLRDDLSLHVWEEPVDMMRTDSATAIRQDDLGISVETAAALKPTQASWSHDRSSVAFVGTVPYSLDDASPSPAPPAGEVRREHVTLADIDPSHNVRTVVPDRGTLQQIFLRRADGLPVQVTTPWTEDWRDGVVTGDARSNTDPVLSPDGSSLVFTSHSSLTNESFLVRMDLRTGDVLNLTNGTAGAQRVDDSSAKWSPDSSLIAFTWTQGSATDVFVMRASDGLQVTHVTDDLATNLTPSWSPDGRSIVYSHHDGQIFVSPGQLVSLTGLVGVYDTGWSLVSVDVATGQQTVLTRPGDPAGWKPVWAPEGDRIYFIGKGPTSLDVFSVSPAGGDVKPVLISPFLNETSIDWR